MTGPRYLRTAQAVQRCRDRVSKLVELGKASKVRPSIMSGLGDLAAELNAVQTELDASHAEELVALRRSTSELRALEGRVRSMRESIVAPLRARPAGDGSAQPGGRS